MAGKACHQRSDSMATSGAILVLLLATGDRNKATKVINLIPAEKRLFYLEGRTGQMSQSKGDCEAENDLHLDESLLYTNRAVQKQKSE